MPVDVSSMVPYWVAVALMGATGLYLVLATRNLLRLIIGLELLTKGVTLLIVLAGEITGRTALAQSFAITLIVVEVVVVVVAAGIALSVFRNEGSLDAGAVRRLKG
ncbi:MAG: NADH-quinone oxidoreductase subunit K [Deltaproteobacteria bacterium]|nr:NADH-quinone oxidoreductase subunit K [Deltaproteobacteria bacterium]